MRVRLCRLPLRSLTNRQMPARIDALAKVLTWFEVWNVLPGERHSFTRLRVTPHSRRPVMQRKAAEASDLDSLTVGQRFAHDLEYVLDGQLDIFGWQMFLFAGNRFNEFGFRHCSAPCSQARIRLACNYSARPLIRRHLLLQEISQGSPGSRLPGLGLVVLQGLLLIMSFLGFDGQRDYARLAIDAREFRFEVLARL